MKNATRIPLIVASAFVALTALGGGMTLVLSSVIPDLRGDFLPPLSYLEGSPFATYLLPGLSLVVLVAIPHAVAAVALGLERAWAPLITAYCGFACLIWIFVQMIFIPFSWLQALYFALGVFELTFVLVGLGVLSPVLSGTSRTRRHRSDAGESRRPAGTVTP